MPTPIEVKGLRKLVDKYVDQVIESKRKQCWARATFQLVADYDFDTDRYSNLGLSVSGVVPASGIPVTAKGNASIERRAERAGQGNLIITFEVASHAPAVEVKP